MMPTSLPYLPWQKVATDLFEWTGSTYLLVIDYYSRWIEITKLDQLSANSVTYQLNICRTWNSPKVVISDNSPQFASESYTRFAKDYGFYHVTSSQYHPGGNGEAERGV